MAKKKNIEVYFTTIIDGKQEMIAVSLEQLRQVIENSNLPRDTKQKVILAFDTGDKTTNIAIEMSTLNMLLKNGELKATDLVPKSLRGYLEDITQRLANKPIVPIVKREHELEKIWFYISQKRRNNVFITGDMDVGKTAIAHEVARQISTNECPKEFYEKRVILLKPEMLFKIKSDRAYEKTVKRVINFLIENRKKIVLYIDNGIYMKTDELLIMMLYSCIKKYNIPMIVTVNEENYDRYFAKDPSMAKYLNEIYVMAPEKDEIKPIIEAHLKVFENRYKVKITEDIIKFGIYTASLSESPSAEPGRVINIFEKAFLEARRKKKKYVDRQCILSCYNTYLKEYENTTEVEKRQTAYHETGHYIARIKSKHQRDMKISCVSILPMMWWAGVTMSYHEPKEYAIHSKEYFIDQIAMSLAGRVAERKFTNLDSIGAANDLEHVNYYAKSIVMKWGLSDKEGNINRSYNYEDYFLMPESKKALIDREIQELINAGTKRAEKIINENEGLLKIIAERLITDEILTGEELEQICKEYEKGDTTEKVEETVERN